MKIHEGHNVKRFRELRRMKQEALAFDLGEDWSQKKISLLEQKETIDPSILERISKVLDVPVEYFQKLDDEQAVNIYENTFGDNAFNYGTINFHPVEEIRKLHDEKMALYERMVKAQDDMIARLEKLIEGK